MPDTIDKILDGVIQREGGFIDHAADRGGPTHFGITQATLSSWRGHSVGSDQVADLTEGEARQIYRHRYVEAPGFDAVPHQSLQGLLIDYGVNAGPAQAIRSLQKALGLDQDGIVGPVTKRGILAYPEATIYKGVLAGWARLYGTIISRDATQAVFAKGWMNRLAEWIEKTP